MGRFILHRLAFGLVSLAGVVVLSFALIHFVPGDPVDFMLGENASAEDRASLRHELGLDQPLTRQFLSYASGLLRMDLGRSLHRKAPVWSEILVHMPATFELSLMALTLAILWGLPLGVLAAAKPSTWRDHSANAFALLGMSLPGIFLGPLLIYAFAVRLDWFPVSDRGSLDHVVLPAVSLALPLGAVILRMTRAAVLDVLGEDYLRTAAAKGASPARIYFRHALRNALIPVVTILGLQLGALLTGTVIMETIFDWPGLGSLLYGAIQRRDYPMIQGCVLFIACTYVFVNLFTDLAYGWVNPKVRT